REHSEGARCFECAGQALALRKRAHRRGVTRSALPGDGKNLFFCGKTSCSLGPHSKRTTCRRGREQNVRYA
ncbi:unnamed protein product, partial [Ectocarpus sp. 12 AP-2014]